jgi:hypothetical protein
MSMQNSNIELPSEHQLGKLVWINLWATYFSGEVCGVHFFPGKVKYDFKVFGENGQVTKLYLIDSAFVSATRIKG